jgi:hypothetical protein
MVKVYSKETVKEENLRRRKKIQVRRLYNTTIGKCQVGCCVTKKKKRG